MSTSRSGRLSVIACFSSKDDQATKLSIAKTLAVAFPELAEKVPKQRKIWQSEDERISRLGLTSGMTAARSPASASEL